MVMSAERRRKQLKKDAPNLRRFRETVLNMVNKRYGVAETEAEAEKVEVQKAIRASVELKGVRKPVPRKQRRKNERVLKKARKLAFSQHKKVPTSMEELRGVKKDISKEREPRLSGAQRRKKAKAKKKKTEELVQKVEKEKEEDARVKALRAKIAEDDKMIKQLSKQMKLNKRKRKNLPAAFNADGLDYLLDAVDSEKLASLYKDSNPDDEEDDLVAGESDSSNFSDSEEEFGKGGMEESDMEQSSSEDEQEDSKQDITDEREDDGDSDEVENEDLIADEVNEHAGESDPSDSEQSGSESDSDDPDEDVDAVREDIYGRTVDKHGKVVQQVSTGAYIPPAKRAAMLSKSESDKVVLERLGKRLKGLLNRLSEANLPGICSEMESLYRSNSRALMNQTLLENLNQSALSLSLIPDRLLMVQAMLVAALHSNVDNEIGAYILQSNAQELDKLLKSDDLGATQKQLHNLLTFLCYLYHFKVVGSLLILDVLRVLCDEFREKHIELIILILRTVGFNLRKDDAAGLKELILKVQEKANNTDLTTFSDQSRLKFMLDVLLAIKNNNTRKLPQYDPDAAMHARKIVAQVTRSDNDSGQFRISLEDLLASESKGAWWRVGSAWSGPSEDRQHENELVVPDKMDDESNTDLLDLARKQRMNTDIRRKIFCTIMGSNDYMDCTEKLLRLGLNHRQEQEIIHVLVDCCLHEKSYNLFYSHLAEKLCRSHRRFTITSQFSIWDRLKTLSDLSKISISNLSQFVSHLILQGALSLSLFKVLNLAELDKKSLAFTRKVLLDVLIQSDGKINETFSKVSQSTKYRQLAISLSAFLQHFVLKNYDKLKLECSREVLERKIGVVDRVLAGENRFGL